MNTTLPGLKLIFSLMPFLVFTLSAARTFAQCTDPPAGLVAWWPAEGNASDVAGTNHGTLQNGATFATGYVGQAFDFDGNDDYVMVPDAASLRLTNLTFEGWVKFSSIDGIQQLVSKTFGTAWHESYGLYLNAGLLVGTVGGENNAFVMYNLNPATGVWYHIAYTFDDAADIHTLFVNGTPVASNPNGHTITYDTHPVILGAEYENEIMDYYLHGAIDEASIYSRALSPSAIAAIYAAGRGGKCQQPGVPATIRVSQVEICWNSDTNSGYQVQYRSDLTTNVWAPLVECMRGSISNTCITDAVLSGVPKRFYRVILTNCLPAP